MHSQVYPPILQDLRETMLDTMAKPKEVLVVIDENGDAVEVNFDDVENIHIYELMRETLVCLTNIDNQAIDKTIQARLDKLTKDKSSFTFEALNKLCWALGSISGCMHIDEENKFVVQVVKELLNLCEKTSGKNNKALVASDIMYVVGQFPNFLIGHWPFLKTVVKKLNEFMHEKHPGVQDMASETFLKISKLTKEKFTLPETNGQPYVIELINMIPVNCKDLESHQRLMVYEGIGYMVSTAQPPQLQLQLIQHLL
jgi:exportin-1